jgi:biotin operon repressor
MKLNITTLEAAKCLSFLESANKPMTAIELARKLYLAGNRESQRRHVRALVEKLRDNGSMIVATLQDGYFLTEDLQLWQDYLEDRQIDAKSILGETHRRKKMLADRQGQGYLFAPGAICCGIG